MGSSQSSGRRYEQRSRSVECRREFFSKDFSEYNTREEWAHDRNKFSEFSGPRQRKNDTFFSSFETASSQYSRPKLSH